MYRPWPAPSQGMTEPSPDHFEMRGLESLSNTIFGVAKTLLAYDLPKPGQFASVPDWADLYHLYAGPGAQLHHCRAVLVQPSPQADAAAARQPGRGDRQSAFSVVHHPAAG